MKSKILVVGFALVSVFAVAQSSNSQADPAKKSSSDVKQPVDANTGRVKSAMQKAEAEAEAKPSTTTTREASSGMPTGKTQRVATGDVNGDGKADVAAGSNSNSKSTPSNATSSTAAASDVKSPRDLATGQASGKRQYNPVTIRKAVDDAPAEGSKKDPNKK